MSNKIDVLEAADTAVRLVPPATVSVLSFNTCLSNTVYALTAVYIVFQIIVLFPKVLAVFKRKDKEDEG